jgi:hypothetical protein
LRTSVLDRVNGELAGLLTGRPGSEPILLDLEDANAFVESLDPHGSHLLVAERTHPTVVAVTVSGGELFLVIRGPG